MMMMGGRYASALETENAMAAMAAKTRAKFRMSITPGSFPQCPKDGESVHPRQTHIYENGRSGRGAAAETLTHQAWSIAQLVDAAVAVEPTLPSETRRDRRRKFAGVEGWRANLGIKIPFRLICSWTILRTGTYICTTMVGGYDGTRFIQRPSQQFGVLYGRGL